MEDGSHEHRVNLVRNRGEGIPARFVMGFPVPNSPGEREAIGGYHCSAYFWTADDGWVPVDISEADKDPKKAKYFFGNLDENRVVYTVGRDLVLPPGQQNGPINFFIYPYVEVDGKKWPHIDRRFSYSDLP